MLCSQRTGWSTLPLSLGTHAPLQQHHQLSGAGVPGHTQSLVRRGRWRCVAGGGAVVMGGSTNYWVLSGCRFPIGIDLLDA